MNPLKKKNDNEILCSTCEHPIIQDVDTGKWYHQNRDTKDACLYSEKNTVCRCENANPFPIKKDDSFQKTAFTEAVEEPGPVDSLNDAVIDDDLDNQKKVSNDSPVEKVLSYLLKEKNYSISDANLVIDCVKKNLVDSLFKEDNS